MSIYSKSDALVYSKSDALVYAGCTVNLRPSSEISASDSECSVKIKMFAMRDINCDSDIKNFALKITCLIHILWLYIISNNIFYGAYIRSLITYKYVHIIYIYIFIKQSLIADPQIIPPSQNNCRKIFSNDWQILSFFSKLATFKSPCQRVYQTAIRRSESNVQRLTRMVCGWNHPHYQLAYQPDKDKC